MRFIGDIHGHYQKYLKLIEGSADSVQVGDFGIGFVSTDDLIFPEGRHRFIRGNHDNPQLCRENPRYIEDGTIEDGVIYLGGAWSIDQRLRTLGVDYWDDEEISRQEMDRLITLYEETKPSIIVSHDVASDILEFSSYSRTQEFLSTLYNIHQPDIWIFGHHHQSMKIKKGNTSFICLAINEVLDIEI